jgi:hypothetical protein
VVDTIGETRAEPLAVMAPTPGVIVIAPGFSAAQLNTTGCPGLMEILSALNSMIRASGHGKFRGNRQPLV